VGIHVSVGSQLATGQLQPEAADALLTADQAPGGSILLVGSPSVQVLSPRTFTSNGTADAVYSSAAVRASAALGASSTPAQELDALVQQVDETSDAGAGTVVLRAEDAAVLAPTLLRAPAATGLLQIRGTALGPAPWAIVGVDIGDTVSRLVIWVSDQELLAYCERGVGVDVPVVVRTLGGTSAEEQTDAFSVSLAVIGYERPIVEEIEPPYSLTGPNVSGDFRIRGQHFGFKQEDIDEVYVGSNLC